MAGAAEAWKFARKLGMVAFMPGSQQATCQLPLPKYTEYRFGFDQGAAMLDLFLACVHHLLIFGVFGTLLAELVLLRPGFDRSILGRISRIDMAYGVFAVLIVVVGFSRTAFGAKGWGYYSHSAFFWAKLATFALVGIVSIRPTIVFIRWKKAEGSPEPSAVRSVRRYLHCELLLFMLLPLFAAAMARGYGEF